MQYIDAPLSIFIFSISEMQKKNVKYLTDLHKHIWQDHFTARIKILKKLPNFNEMRQTL